MDICASRHRWEEELAEAQRESVAHCVNEDVWCEKGEGIVGCDEGAKRLPQKSHVWPAGGEDIVAGCEVEEGNGWGVEVDVETVLWELVSIDFLLTRDGL